MKPAFRDWPRDIWGALLGGYTSFLNVFPPLPRVPAQLQIVLCLPKFLAGTYHEEMKARSPLFFYLFCGSAPPLLQSNLRDYCAARNVVL